MRDSLERLKYTRVRGSDQAGAAAKIVGRKIQNFRDNLRAQAEERRIRKESRALEDYKAQHDRRRVAELRVYGHELSEKERADYQRTIKAQQKERDMRRQRAFGSLGVAPAPRPRRIYRSRRYVAPARPQPLLGDLGGTADFLGVGGGSVAPIRRRKKADLSLGGLI